MTLYDRGYSPEEIADMFLPPATDFYFTGDGHALDFANKMFEALDYVDWEGANEILRPIVVDLVGRERHEETAGGKTACRSWKIFSPVWTRCGKRTRPNGGILNISAFTQTLLGEEFEPIVAEIEGKLREGVKPTDICRAMTYAGAIRTARFHLKNEGDWHDVANIYSYAHALYHAFHRAPSKELLRGIFHGAVFMTYLRWLNMQRPPAQGRTSAGTNVRSETNVDRLRSLRISEGFEAEVLVSQYLEEGYDIAKLRHTLAHIMLREDAELHMFQVLEVAFRHYDLSDDPKEKRMHLLAATRYITAQKVMKGILWSTENAERLQRGELLSERDDDKLGQGPGESRG